MAMYGFPPPDIPLKFFSAPTDSEATGFLENRNTMWQHLKVNLAAAQARMKKYANMSERVELSRWTHQIHSQMLNIVIST